MTRRVSAKRSGTKSLLICVQTWWPTTRNVWLLWLPRRVLPPSTKSCFAKGIKYLFDSLKCKSIHNFFLNGFFCIFLVVILSLTVQINLSLKLQTDNFFVSGKTYKISMGSKQIFHCIYKYIYIWGVTRHLSHETRRDTRLGSREREKIFWLFFKDPQWWNI